MSGRYFGGNPCNGCPLYEVCDAGECGARYDLMDDMSALDGQWQPKSRKALVVAF